MQNRIDLMVKRIVIPAMMLVALSACTPPTQQMSWEHIRDGLHENLSTDDHI